MLLWNNGPVFRQYAIVITINLSTFCTGLGAGWVSPMLVKLSNSTDTQLSRPISLEEGSWIVSSVFIAGVPFSFLAAYLMNKIGRKHTVIIGCAPKIIICLMYTFATDVWMLYVGRLLWGITDNIIFCAVPAYASEIASKEIRGMLGTIRHLNVSFGMLVMFAIGPFMSYFTLNVVFTCLVIASTMPLLFLTDSPYSLYSHDHKEESLKVLKSLRNSEHLANEEIIQYHTANNKTKVDNNNKLYKNAVFIKTTVISVIFSITGQILGQYAVVGYLQTILESTKTSISPEWSSIAIGSLQFLAGFINMLLIDNFGRKPILTCSLLLTAIGWIGLGTFFKLKEIDSNLNAFMDYVPIISLILIVVCCGAGYISNSLTVTAELFDSPERAMGVTISVVSMTVSVFIVTKCFALITTTLGPALTYWMFSVNCLLTCLFIYFFIPETNGKSFAEIQAVLGKKVECDNVESVKL